MAANHDTGFYCDFCNFFCSSTQSLCFFKHLVNNHSNDPNVKVYCGYCPRSFTVKDSTKTLLSEYFEVVKNVLQEKICDEVGAQFQFSRDMDELFEVDKV